MRTLFLLIFLCIGFTTLSQEKKKRILYPNKIGFLYNNANDKNFLFDDKDYYYETNTFKSQFFYSLGVWKKIDFQIIVQPQIQVIKHQLHNKFFVLDTEENYQQKRIEFTKLKTMYLYALEIGIAANKKLFKKLELQTTIGLGVATITKRTERLAKGFTFIENGALGFSYLTFKNTFLYVGTNIGHVSNFNLKSPNNGYNILGFEIGLSYQLK